MKHLTISAKQKSINFKSTLLSMHEIVNLRNVHTLVIIVNILILLTGYIIYNQLQPFWQTNQLTS